MARLKKIGWIVDSSSTGIYKWPWQELSIVAQIRYGLIAKHLARQGAFQIELYKPYSRYDAVVFVKMMNASCLSLAEALKKKGVKIVFDANVNYYEEWGDYVIPGTRPTTQQKQQAQAMTALADVVIADSSYLLKICQHLNANVVWIPDAVDTSFFAPARLPSARTDQRLRLIWSGISKKAHHLELIEPILHQLSKRIHLCLVTDIETSVNLRAPVVERLKTDLGAEIILYTRGRFRDSLQQSDVIISPKIINNAYEASHTEYKITTGMSAGLPALASPQASYVDAIGDDVGGRICDTSLAWEEALYYFIEQPEHIQTEGFRARQRVKDRYSTEAVALQYRHALGRLWS